MIVMVACATASIFFVLRFFDNYTSAVTLELAGPDDADVAEQVLVKSIDVGYRFLSQPTFDELLSTKVLYNTLQHFKKSLQSDQKEKCHILLAKIQGKVVGYIFTHKITEAALFIEHLFILPDFFRHGIGKKLVNESISIFKRTNPAVNKILVNTRLQNQRSQTFYYKLGFYRINEYPERDYVMCVLMKDI